jgi:hypothetical protein
LETIVAALLGGSVEVLASSSLHSRRQVRRSLVTLFLTSGSVEDENWADHPGWASMLQLLPPSLLQRVQNKVVRAAASLGLEAQALPSAAGASSSSSAPLILTAPPPPPIDLLDAFDIPEDIETAAADANRQLLDYSDALVGAVRRAWVFNPAAADHMDVRLLPAVLPVGGGVFPWDLEEKSVIGHIFRHVGEQLPHWVYGRNWEHVQQHLDAGNPLGVPGTVPSLESCVAATRAWLQARPALWSKLEAGVLAGPPMVSNFSESGAMFGWRIRGGIETDRRDDWQIAFHGSALYCLQSILINGFQVGWSGVNIRGTQRFGVYIHARERVHLCNHYLLHSALDRSGWFVGPLIQVRFPEVDPQGRLTKARRATKSTMQWITYPDVICPTHLWFHAFHASELWHEPSFGGHYVEGIFQPPWELDPSMEWSALLERSRTNAMP